MSTLFDSIRLGAIAAPNRILMAPLTRGRSVAGHVPITSLKAEYYSQRAAAGLIIAEATGISQEGLGWPSAPGIWSEAQVEPAASCLLPHKQDFIPKLRVRVATPTAIALS